MIQPEIRGILRPTHQFEQVVPDHLTYLLGILGMPDPCLSHQRNREAGSKLEDVLFDSVVRARGWLVPVPSALWIVLSPTGLGSVDGLRCINCVNQVYALILGQLQAPHSVQDTFLLNTGCMESGTHRKTRSHPERPILPSGSDPSSGLKKTAPLEKYFPSVPVCHIQIEPFVLLR